MPRYFVDDYNIKNLIIDKDNYHHLKVVNRCKIGEVIELFNNDITYSVKITKINKDTIEFEIIDQFYYDTEFNFHITLMQSYPKGDKLEEIIKRGKDDNAIRMINNLTFEIDKLTAQKNEILGRLRDPFKTDFDIIKETSDKNLKSLEKEIIQELLNEEIDRYIDIASVTNKPRMVLLDDCLLENYDKFNSLLYTLKQKNYVIQLTNSELKADCILVENEERKKELGDKAITIKEFEERWGIKFNDQLFKITK